MKVKMRCDYLNNQFAVLDVSEPNQEIPEGTLRVRIVDAGALEVGKEYNVEITPASE
jgi:hypothetical protein